MVSDQGNFDSSLESLGNLYEEGKDCVNSILTVDADLKVKERLLEILAEMRNITATALQNTHFIKEN